MQTLASLQKGHEFPVAELTLSEDWVSEYVVAVEDKAIRGLGSNLVPPMAVATLTIRVLLESSGLPPGAIHVGQELSFGRGAIVGDRVKVRARIASRGERAGWVLMGVDMDVRSGDEQLMAGRGLITFPAEGVA